jgi:hypothetical protein
MKGLCELCGKQMLDTKMYKFTDVDVRKKWKIEKAEKEKKKEIKQRLKLNKKDKMPESSKADSPLEIEKTNGEKKENVREAKVIEEVNLIEDEDDDYYEVIDISTVKKPSLTKKIIK